MKRARTPDIPRETLQADPPTAAGNGQPEELQQRIARRAFELWEQNGCQDDREVEDWLEAEREISMTHP